MSTRANATTYEIEMEGFSGPLHLLLELIEREELPITNISLARVTQPYLEEVERGEVASDHLADFLLVATRLLYLKSKELLPDLQAEEEEGAERLSGQLRLYQLIMEAAKELEGAYDVVPSMWHRPKPSLPDREQVAPPTGLTSVALEEAFSNVLRGVRPFLSLRQTTMERVRSVGERMEELRSMIGIRARMAFKDLVHGAKSKMEVVVSFLALLELVKQRTVRTEQTGVFDDITIDRYDVT